MLFHSYLLICGRRKDTGPYHWLFLSPNLLQHVFCPCGGQDGGRVSDIFCGVRGEETELTGSWGLQQSHRRPGSCSGCPSLPQLPPAQGTGIQPHQHFPFIASCTQCCMSLLRLVSTSTGLSQLVPFPSCFAMGCPTQHGDGDLQKAPNPYYHSRAVVALSRSVVCGK